MAYGTQRRRPFFPSKQGPGQAIIRPAEMLYRVPFSALSHFQQATVQEAEKGSGHLVVEAVAGSGKTENILHMLGAYKRAHPTHQVLCVAFNNNIKSVLAGRIPLAVADVMTAHGLGYGSPSAGRSGLGGAAYGVVGTWGMGKPGTLDLQGPDGDLMHSLISSRHGSEPETYPDRAELCRLISLCKTRLAGLTLDGKEDPAGISEVIQQHGLQFGKFDSAEILATVLWILQHTKKQPGLVVVRNKYGKSYEKKAITFDDQIWLPLMHGWNLPQYDLILVDEGQDLSQARFSLIRQALKPGGRMLVVGDRYQGIYTFAGADAEALPNIIRELGAKTLPLSITYRCAKNIVAEAQQYNPQIQAGEKSELGTVDSLDAAKLPETVKIGDAIISRTNAPLVSLFFLLAKNGKRVVMLGREYGLMLANRVKAWRARAQKQGLHFTGEDLLSCNQTWMGEGLLRAGESAGGQQRVRDEGATIEILATDLSAPLASVDAVEEVLSRIYRLFSSDGDASKDAITLSSTHKFKGDERDRIFMLTETYKLGANQEETNLCYVAITRARKHLTYVTGIKKLSARG